MKKCIAYKKITCVPVERLLFVASDCCERTFAADLISFRGVLPTPVVFLGFIFLRSLFICATRNLSTEAIAQRCSVKKVFLEIPQNSQESTCARVSFLTKLQA